MASQQVAVDDVVVQQRVVVHELDRNRRGQRRLPGPTSRFCRKQRERGTDRLAGRPGRRVAVLVAPAEMEIDDAPDRRR